MREKLAELAHKQWSGWMKYMFSKCHPPIHHTEDGILIPSSLVKRWTRQMNTPYSNLPEEEKESDREEADKYLDLMGL